MHLHVHSAYSLLRGVCRLEELVARAAEAGMPAVGLTDWANLYGAVRFYQLAREAGIRPILGVQLPIVEETGPARPGVDLPAVVLLAESEIGYRSLIRLVSLAHERPEPAVSWQVVADHRDGLILLSGGREGPVDRAFARGDSEGARLWAARFADVFGRDRAFLELQDDGTAQARLAHFRLASLAKEFGLSTVATGDVHYLSPGDAGLARVVRAIREG
ncbi:MAG: PHP domain-containing protein, partial [Alicyclobacillaceae bacterium]|nr:PHP domain-containing protein [Alicyclobacillaceae bacterium]